MNKLIKQQLKLCKKARIPDILGDETKILIPKGIIQAPQNVVVGGYYIIELEQYVVLPPPNFTLHDNWNNGIAPKEKVMQCVVDKEMGKMVHINGIGYDRINSCYIDGTEWQGWLPTKSIEVIRRLG